MSVQTLSWLRCQSGVSFLKIPDFIVAFKSQLSRHITSFANIDVWYERIFGTLSSGHDQRKLPLTSWTVQFSSSTSSQLATDDISRGGTNINPLLQMPGPPLGFSPLVAFSLFHSRHAFQDITVWCFDHMPCKPLAMKRLSKMVYPSQD